MTLHIKDEAARIPDDLNRAGTPMLAVSKGQEIDLSTPFGQRGYFWRDCTDPGCSASKHRVTWRDCPRHTADFIAEEERRNGRAWVAQEYECSFESLSGLVYPDFDGWCGIDLDGPCVGRPVGGLDFGFRDPFAAVWGYYDPHDDCLVIRGERDERERGLHEHAAALPPGVEWEADPSQPQQILELRRGGFVVRKAFNKIEPGVAAVRSRVERGKLKVIRRRCPNLIAEAQALPLRPGPAGREPARRPQPRPGRAAVLGRPAVPRLHRQVPADDAARPAGRPGRLPPDEPRGPGGGSPRPERPFTAHGWSRRSGVYSTTPRSGRGGTKYRNPQGKGIYRRGLLHTIFTCYRAAKSRQSYPIASIEPRDMGLELPGSQPQSQTRAGNSSGPKNEDHHRANTL